MSKKRIKTCLYLIKNYKNTIYSILFPGGVEKIKFISEKGLGETAAIVLVLYT
jgi:hypothetical protein